MLPVFYSQCPVLTVGCYLYLNQGMSIPAPNQFYSDGNNCYEIVNGSIASISSCTTACDLTITSVTSTDPTTLGGTDGTITVNFTTSNGPTTYTVNGGPSNPAVSPLIITGRSAATPYTVVLTDANLCTVTSTITLGQSATLLDADWIMATFEFTNGSDLDTRSRIAIPNVGMTSQSQYLGWAVNATYGPPVYYSPYPNPVPANYLMMWGGDNTGTGFESILVNVKKFKIDYPSATEFVVDLRAFWYSVTGTNPVNVAVTLWKGGTPVRDSCLSAGNPYCWSNPTASFTTFLESVPKVITLNTTVNTTPGQRVATLKYNLTTFIAVLNNNDTTTPVVT